MVEKLLTKINDFLVMIANKRRKNVKQKQLRPRLPDFTAHLIQPKLHLNPLSPHDALKHHFTSLKIDLIFLQPIGFRTKISMNFFTNKWSFSLMFKPHQNIFIHYKSSIATAIRGL